MKIRRWIICLAIGIDQGAEVFVLPDQEFDASWGRMTRPASALGASYEALVVEGVVVILIFLLTSNPLYLLFFAPILGVRVLASAQNPESLDENDRPGVLSLRGQSQQNPLPQRRIVSSLPI